MTGDTRRQMDHPILGAIDGRKEEWRLQRETAIPWLGYSTRNIIIVSESPVGQPSSDQLEALIALIEQPPSFRGMIAQAIHRAYAAEIRPEYAERFSDPRADYGVSIADLPQIEEAGGIWKVITGLYGVWVHEDAAIGVSFSVTFDEEHELHVEVVGSRADRVWME